MSTLLSDPLAPARPQPAPGLANLPRLSAALRLAGLDAIVATSPENVCYLTGVLSGGAQNHPHDGTVFAVAEVDDPGAASYLAPLGELDDHLGGWPARVAGHGTFHRVREAAVELLPHEQRVADVAVLGPDPISALAALLHERGLATARIGWDHHGVPHHHLPALARALPRAEFVDGTALLRQVRKVKTAAELDRLTRVAAVTERAIMAACEEAGAGASEREVVRAFEASVVRADARPRFTSIRVGRRGALGHQPLEDRRIGTGEAIWFDVGCTLDGYWSDLARVATLGQPHPKLAAYQAAMSAGVAAAVELARPGMTGAELFARTTATVRHHGVPHYRRHHVGHGIGLEIYDPVLIRPDEDDVLEEGTVVNVETPYYEYGFGAAHAETPFVLGPGGGTVLTTLDWDLIVLD